MKCPKCNEQASWKQFTRYLKKQFGGMIKEAAIKVIEPAICPSCKTHYLLTIKDTRKYMIILGLVLTPIAALFLYFNVNYPFFWATLILIIVGQIANFYIGDTEEVDYDKFPHLKKK